MFNRWVGILSALGMILANTAIIMRDLLPDWQAGDPPPSPGLLEQCESQVGIYDAYGRLLGRSWTRSNRIERTLVRVNTTTVLYPVQLPSLLRTPHVRVETEVTYSYGQKTVKEVDLKVHGLGMPVCLHGANVAGDEFPCTWRVGEGKGEFSLNSKAPAALGEILRPFDRLPNLYVGQTWRVDLVDPLSQIFPSLKGSGVEIESVVMEVTGTEVFSHDGKETEAFLVEGGHIKAWVDADGRVLCQEVDNVPLLGKLILYDEPFDAGELKKSKESVPSEQY